MAFINIPIIFIEEETEQQENLGLKPNTKEGEVNVNTQLICSYHEMDNKSVMIRLANGDCIEVDITIDEFEEILGEVESIIEIPKVSPN